MGPELDTAPTPLIQLACEKIVDKSNYHTYVVIGGIGTYEPRIWDTQTAVSYTHLTLPTILRV